MARTCTADLVSVEATMTMQDKQRLLDSAHIEITRLFSQQPIADQPIADVYCRCPSIAGNDDSAEIYPDFQGSNS